MEETESEKPNQMASTVAFNRIMGLDEEVRRQLFDQIQEVDFSEGFDYVPLETTPTGSQHV